MPPLVRAYSRITPAYAGKSVGNSTCGACRRDHPRLCGEKVISRPCGSLWQGSPPPMRGKVIVPLRDLADFRITPAYAGKSVYECTQRPLRRDHPRLCGEKVVVFFQHHIMGGSPPPMRGKAGSIFQPAAECRITPAYAGKSRAVEVLAEGK